jgi:hypothetical protein
LSQFSLKNENWLFSKINENCPTLVRTTNNKSTHNNTMKRIIVRKKTKNTRPPRGKYPSNRKKIMTTKKNIGTQENHEEDHKHHKH